MRRVLVQMAACRLSLQPCKGPRTDKRSTARGYTGHLPAENNRATTNWRGRRSEQAPVQAAKAPESNIAKVVYA